MLDRTDVLSLIDRLAGRRVAVVGDLILDRYIVGTAKRISPEAPVPVVRVSKRRSALGGAANVLRNLRALGMTGIAFGIVGDDGDGRELCEICQSNGIRTDGVLVDGGRPTTVKTRVIADQQQLVRIDDEEDRAISSEMRGRLTACLIEQIGAGAVDAVILEDYHKGVIDEPLACEIQKAAAEHGVLVALDPHPGNPMKVPGLTLMTPNRAEAFALTGAYFRDTVLPVTDDADLLRVGERLLAEWESEMLLITLGPDGMALFQAGEPVHHEPTVAREVFDVSGAGDTVIAAFCSALLGGWEPHQAMVFANHAGGVVVGRLGTVPVDREALVASFAEGKA